MDEELKGYLRVKHFNRKLERFYYYLSLDECKYIKERLERSVFNIPFNLTVLYLNEIEMLRSVIKIKEDTIASIENARIEDIRKRYKKKLKRKFI